MTLPWEKPRYCVSVREDDAPPEVVARRWMRRRACCDCGHTVIYAGAPLLYELIVPYLVICNVCAHERTIEAGDRSWTWTVEPRPRPQLD